MSRSGEEPVPETESSEPAAGLSEPSPYLSVVIPAYNEQDRLPATLAAVRAFLSEQRFDWEIVVVDDGSDDDTARIATGFTGADARVRLISETHRGKAAAVRAGVGSSTGRNVLFTDADLSTPIECVNLLLARRDEGYDLAIGSREGSAARRIGEPHYRHLMGRAFNWVVRLTTVRGIKDTQCGFKLVSRQVADDVFPRLRVSQSDSIIRGPRVSAFDVELLFLARRRGFAIAEVPVIWTHARGSKVRPGVDAVRMFVDVLAVRWNALRGKYN